MTDLFGGASLNNGGTILAEGVNHIVGTEATLLSRPNGTSTLMLVADKGNWRVRVGDHVSGGMPSTEDPTEAVSDDSGSMKIKEGVLVSLGAPKFLTVIGFDAASVMTFWWV